MTGDGWHPDRYAIAEHLDSDERVHARCCCGATAVLNYAAYRRWRASHRCPPGSWGAWPECPECGATRRVCRTERGGPGSGIREWHPQRVEVYMQVTGERPPLLPDGGEGSDA